MSMVPYRSRGKMVAYRPKRRYAPVTRYVKRYKKRYYSKSLANAKFWGNTYVPTVMPLKWKFTTRYVDVYKQLSATPGSMATYTYVANGLYDPDLSGGGHQPIGFDQMMSFYDHYTVIASKIKVEVQNESDQHAVIAALHVSDDSTTPLSQIQTLIENGSTKWRRLVRQGSDSSFINNNKSSCTLTQKVNVKKFLGRPNILSEDDLRGNLAENPNESIYYKIMVQSIDGSADSVQLSASIQIDYIAILTEPKVIQQS